MCHVASIDQYPRRDTSSNFRCYLFLAVKNYRMQSNTKLWWALWLKLFRHVLYGVWCIQWEIQKWFKLISLSIQMGFNMKCTTTIFIPHGFHMPKSDLTYMWWTLISPVTQLYIRFQTLVLDGTADKVRQNLFSQSVWTGMNTLSNWKVVKMSYWSRMSNSITKIKSNMNTPHTNDITWDDIV